MRPFGPLLEIASPARVNSSILNHMHPSIFFIDLDETVYSPQCGMWDLIGAQMNVYMQERLNLPADEVQPLRKRLFREYGTTLRGLKTLYHIDERDFLRFVHDVPVQDVLRPDPALREMLAAYPQRKIIFTNADQEHARRVMNVLGITGCFENIIDILDISPHCKPEPQAFAIALKLAGSPDPADCVLIDDSPANLATARALGMLAIGIGQKDFNGCCDAALASLHELPAVIPFP
ncbi:MAG TPA: pyrimidine 5'-nucleotidase [Anaerolineaceae bacterium]|nr:pyrimidine 5'-nucleotidase [Anaerolineaceae bacterium]